MTAFVETFIVGDTGYVAEVVGIASALDVPIHGLVGEAHALTLATRLALTITAATIDGSALPESCSVIVTLGPPPVRERFARSLTTDQ